LARGVQECDDHIHITWCYGTSGRLWSSSRQAMGAVRMVGLPRGSTAFYGSRLPWRLGLVGMAGGEHRHICLFDFRIPWSQASQMQHPNNALLTDTYTSPLRAQRGAAKRGR